MFNPIQSIPERYLKMSQTALEQHIQRIKDELGTRLFMPTHHYQKDEVVQFADVTGDSLELARICKNNREADYFVFNGVHFMAETADILTDAHQHIYLPDLTAGCSMADMANINQVRHCHEVLTQTYQFDILPLTYVNSTAAIKKYVGQHEGTCLTSGNAKAVVNWALEQHKMILFLPDQHLGRNTAYELGVPLEQMALWDPIEKRLTYEGDLKDLRLILWKGHCSVHEKFRKTHIEQARQQNPDVNIIVHPECPFDVVQAADEAGSTRYIIDAIQHAPAGSHWRIGTEMNLVHRLKMTHPELHIESLNPLMCACLTMNRIDLPHLAWCLDKILNDQHDNIIKVDDETAYYAKKSLDRMLSIV
ncbi:quinolinate synthase NadA [Staphylococcus lutrae]|uniref:Quinolinate synthase n=1 Tax=Staphylococcus lutrae TaxID=155085 RepID=A0AAC9RU26_9STAP|nr:quinolinate synthase NadA [Staphylococcus lutrae]ARJ50855.1 quinolinate synthetase [Staphylococcus lutrae]PNZ39842.1 quinolinate synthase NadA [Staphylococcus lutrae]